MMLSGFLDFRLFPDEHKDIAAKGHVVKLVEKVQLNFSREQSYVLLAGIGRSFFNIFNNSGRSY